MRTFFAVTVTLLLAGTALAQGGKNDPLKTEDQKAAYALGMNFGGNLLRQGVEVEFDSFFRGFRDAMEQNQPLLDDQEIQDVLIGFRARMQEKREREFIAKNEKNEKEGAAFLAANKKKNNVVTTASGLQYRVIRAGKGEFPTASDTVVTHYKGTLIDGTVFDSSYQRGEPASFQTSGVIRGWTEALLLMKVGSKWELYIPPELAYGVRGSLPAIGPNATLIFEIELLEIK